ncbi:MAG: helix-turn-helix transcriptional regulator [Ferrovum myxofaciens]|nr:helix-turn-helix transcriptional regulator [Ferrovum myxofaciens]
MIKFHLSRLMGERKLKIADLARDLNVNRGSIGRMYHETTEKVDVDLLNSLCGYFKCGIADLMEYTPAGENLSDSGHTENR